MPVSRRRLLFVIFVTTVTGITSNTLIGPAIPNILDEFGASDASAGLIVAAGSMPGIVVAPFVGFIADRRGRREVLVPCLVLFGVAGGLAGLAPNLASLVGLRMLQGVGSAGLINLAIVVIGDNFSGGERARMIGRNSAVLTACLALFPLLGGLITAQFGWRAVFAVYPVAVGTAALVQVTLPRFRGNADGSQTRLADVLPIIRRPEFTAVLGGTVLVFGLIFGALLTLMPVHLERTFGVDEATRGLLLGLPALGALSGSLATGSLSARYGRRRVAMLAAPLFTVALLTMAAADSLAVLVAAVTLFGLGEGLAIPLMQDIAASAGGPAQRGTLVATQVGMSRFGQTVGPLALSPLSGAVGRPTTFGIAAIVAALPLGALLWRATPPAPRPAEPTVRA